jgi:hypothetical protein
MFVGSMKIIVGYRCSATQRLRNKGGDNDRCWATSRAQK